jgi:hypothetical protein
MSALNLDVYLIAGIQKGTTYWEYKAKSSEQRDLVNLAPSRCLLSVKTVVLATIDLIAALWRRDKWIGVYKDMLWLSKYIYVGPHGPKQCFVLPRADSVKARCWSEPGQRYYCYPISVRHPISVRIDCRDGS